MNIKSVILLFIFSPLTIKGFCQDNQHFQLNGLLLDSTIKKIEILYIQKEKNFSVNKKIINPTDSVFVFEGATPHPYAVYLRFNDTVRSQLFFIDKGHQEVQVNNIDSPLVINHSKINEEYQNNYLSQINKIENNYDQKIAKLRLEYNFEDSTQAADFKEKLLAQLTILRLEKRKIIMDYINSYHNSYVGLWVLYFDTQYFGYDAIYKDVDKSLGEGLLSTVIGKEIIKNLKTSAALKVGSKFPTMQSLTNFVKSESFEFKKQYTLIDFWFSHCGPCISQFPELKRLYSVYKNQFSIFSISIDEDSILWKKTIKVHKLNWPQFLDKSGLNAQQLIINKFPTNFLIDENGVIIEKDISLNKLKELLEAKK